MRTIRGCAVMLMIAASAALSGCETLNGLGTDNTPQPAPLKKIQTAETLKILWNKKANAGVGKDYLKLGPVAVDGRIYSADAAGKVVALNAASGQTIWQANTKASIISGPTVGAGLVVVATANAQLLAFNQASGAVLWRATLPNQILAAPQIDQDKIILTTISGKLIALSAQTGQQLWLYDHGAPNLVLRGGSLPQIANDKVFVGFADGKLAAFDLGDGHLIWQSTIAMPQGAAQVQQMVDIIADPVIADGVIYVATYQGKIAAVSPQNGEVLWLQNISSYTGIAIGPQQVVVTDATGNVWAFSRKNGQVLWTQTQLQNRKLTAPLIVGDTVIVADAEGYVHGLSLADGHLRARVLISKDNAILAAPVVSANMIYVATQNGKVAALRFGS